MCEIELLKELLQEVREIRKSLDTFKIILGDMQTRLAHIETSRMKYPESTRYV